MIPSPWEFALLALAAARVWKLIGDDRILDRPRKWALDYLREERAYYWHDFLTCPWCAGFWITLAWWGAWLQWPHATLIAASPWAISAVVGAFGTLYHVVTD